VKQPETIQCDLLATYSNLELLSDLVRTMLLQIDGIAEPDITIYNMQLAADEIFANIAGHAYEGRNDGKIIVTLIFDEPTRRFTIEFYDTGASFEPSDVPIPDVEDLPEGGFGLFLAQQLMDELKYTPLPSGNYWHLVKQL
jgi:serine/threonine-protein kinase RsbW